MAFHFASCAARARLISLPPQVRFTVLQNAKSFSVSSRRSDLIDSVAAPPMALLDAVHGLGLPWYATIPLMAVAVRYTLSRLLPSTDSIRDRDIRSMLGPLTHARIGLALSAQSKSPQIEALSKMEPGPMRTFLTTKKILAIRRKLAKEHGVPYFRSRVILNFLSLIWFTEAIRLKAGLNHGLLAFIFRPFVWLWENAVAARYASLHVEITNVARPVTSVYSDNGAVDQLRTVEPQVSPPILHARRIDAESPYFDASMQTEGLPWVPDLALPDTTFILPGSLFCAAMIGFVAVRILRTLEAAPSKPPAIPKLGFLFASIFTFLALHMPAGMLLYLVPSIAFGSLRGAWMAKKYPVKPEIMPAKRPMRTKVKRTW